MHDTPSNIPNGLDQPRCILDPDVPQTKVDRLVVCNGVEWVTMRTALVRAAPAGGSGCDLVTDIKFLGHTFASTGYPNPFASSRITPACQRELPSKFDIGASSTTTDYQIRDKQQIPSSTSIFDCR